MVITEGTLLGGRVRYSQPAHGFRSGIEPVLLAASVPVRQPARVLEAGTGAGAALLCLAARLPGVDATGVEIDPETAGLASANAAANGFAGIRVIAGPIESVALPGSFDHAIANPPYHRPDGSASPVIGRERAKRASDALLESWVHRLGGLLRERGTLTLVLPSGLVPAALGAMQESRCPCSVIYPLWPKADRPAKLVLLRGRRLGRTPMRLVPGLVLHEADGSFTRSARAVLENGAALDLDGGASDPAH